MSLENQNYSGLKPPGDEYDVNADGKPLTDGSAVKFIPQDNFTDKNGDAKVDINLPKSQVPFAGMGKEDLLKYANEPFWVRLRWALFILFWIAWVAMLAGAIALIVLAPRCPLTPILPWFKKSPIYKIEPRSFKDSDSDGMGDLKGVESKIDYLNELGVKTVLLGSIYSSSDSVGEDVFNYTQVDSKLGTEDDLKNLIRTLHDNDIKLILDFIPNHSSRIHPWFLNGEKRKKYYVWVKGTKNNWLNKNNNSAWASDGNEYFYHKFNESQPDLNWHNADLKEEMKAALIHWLDLKVDGFNMKDVQYLFESEDQKIETTAGEYTEHQPETFTLIHELKQIMENYTETVLLLDVSGNVEQMVRYYGNSTMPNGTRGGDLVINYQLMHLSESITGFQLSNIVNKTMQHIHPFEWPSWMLSDSISGHVATRFQKTDLVDCFNALLIMLKGTPITYYGDEIGLADNPNLNANEAPFTPMSWNKADNAGFSNSTNAWLSPSPKYETVNVVAQKDSPGPSHLKFYKELVKLRKEPSVSYGNISIALVNEQIFSFLREASGGSHSQFLTILNLKNESYTITSHDVETSKLPPSVRLFLPGTSTIQISLVDFQVLPLAALIFKI